MLFTAASAAARKTNIHSTQKHAHAWTSTNYKGIAPGAKAQPPVIISLHSLLLLLQVSLSLPSHAQPALATPGYSRHLLLLLLLLRGTCATSRLSFSVMGPHELLRVPRRASALIFESNLNRAWPINMAVVPPRNMWQARCNSLFGGVARGEISRVTRKISSLSSTSAR